MAMNWDWVITVLIIVGLILAIWAKVSQQTIMELIKSITEYIKEMKEEKE